jgi:hypothetical protein
MLGMLYPIPYNGHASPITWYSMPNPTLALLAHTLALLAAHTRPPYRAGAARHAGRAAAAGELPGDARPGARAATLGHGHGRARRRAALRAVAAGEAPALQAAARCLCPAHWKQLQTLHTCPERFTGFNLGFSSFGSLPSMKA